MKPPRLYLLLLALLFAANISAQYSWRKKACLPALPRIGTAQFVLNNKAYVVGGYCNSILPADNEVWQYDPLTNKWTRINDFPVRRDGSMAFVINDTAYVGIGRDENGTFRKEFWRYEQASDSWTPIATFPGVGRYLGMTFAIGNKGYLGCGKGAGLNKDFYEYDPALNQWTRKADFPGSARQTGFGLSVGGNGYVGMGWDGSPLKDAYKYEPISDTWTRLNDFPGPARLSPAYFLLNDTIYIAGGRAPNPLYDDCWMYDLPNDNWVQQKSFTCIGPPRSTNYGFTLFKNSYLMGEDAGTGTFITDLLEFGPADNTFIDPSSILGNDTSYCGSFSQTLSTGISCTEWSTGEVAAEITVSSFGTYWAYYPDTCGMSSDTIHITPSSSTPFSLGNDTAYCGSFSRTLSTGIPNTSWSTGETASQIIVTAPGIYSATISNNCGTISDTISFTTATAPAINLGNDTALCSSQTFILNATSTNATYRWQDNSTSPTYTVSSAGIYTVTVTNSEGCSAIESINIGMGTPVINLGNDTTICSRNGIILDATTADGIYQWQDNSTGSSYHVVTSGTYSVTASNNCGTASDQISIEVLQDDCQPLIPTAFSPNQDGVNDLFRIFSHCPIQSFHLKVYNRWGQMVFESSNISDSWDGVYKDLVQPLSVFVYQLEYFNHCEGKTKTVAGNVTLVK